ncbi:SDR family NAD(P)-dependent oxidoreductase [Actinoplanes sp. NPDC004185]
MTRIAVVGMACRYPDATSPRELWENALAGRRAFRRLPDQRMRLADYWSPDPAAPDRFYARNAAVLEGWTFDRVAYKVAGSTYRATDLTHWLALDVAAAAFADAGFPMAAGLPHERTAVIVGNSLTGEFSRAGQLRLRWPYVRRTVAAALTEQKWEEDRLAEFLDRLEADFKAPFPPVDEDSLAGALSNTIAGRICNYFDLKGGGYSVDGACSSSLLSIITACRALADDDVDVAVAGGVDLSIDPLETVGFAKTGALATGEMRVYDRRSSGFWPGEGCGMVVLMREDEARAAGHRVYATIAGWGISSDGKGGITRPEVDGYRLALRRAYERAGFPIDTVALFEGHGTGTKVGDATELAALADARRAAGPTTGPAAISSVKAMIGHTKAAAGVAGFIKAVLAVHHEVLPPAVSCPEPLELLTADDAVLRVLRHAEAWPADQPVRAGITAMGFGGINTHVVVENAQPTRRPGLDARTAALTGSIQDAELLAFDGDSWQAVRDKVSRLADVVGRVSFAQMGDLADVLRRQTGDRPFRAAAVVTSPDDAEARLRRICELIDTGQDALAGGDGAVFLGHVTRPGRVGLLFPGQGSGTGTSGGALSRRFAEIRDVYADAGLPAHGDLIATEVAQPRITTGSVAGLRTLDLLGMSGTVAIGHSLGELTALRWAGAMDDSTLLRVATRRGQVMSRNAASGTMAGIAAPPEVVESLIAELPAVISGYNGPVQTVVAGPEDAVQEVCRRATHARLRAVPLAVSDAFHSPLMAPAAGQFAAALADLAFGQVGRRVISTVTGAELEAGTDLGDLLHRQMTQPVLFHQAVTTAAADVDMFVEVGPGQVLSRLAETATGVPAVSLDTDDESMRSLLRVVAAAYVRGAAGLPAVLFDDRLVRPVRVDDELDVLSNPCENAPRVDVLGGVGHGAWSAPAAAAGPGPADTAADSVAGDDAQVVETTADLLRRLAAARAELPVEMVREDSMLLDELHLSSITVGSIVNEVAARLGIPPAGTPLNFATASVRELAETLDGLQAAAAAGTLNVTDTVAGASSWARAWTIDLDPRPLTAGGHESGVSGRWRLYSEPDHPFAEELRHRLENAGIGAGVLVCLPAECEEEHLEFALRGAQEAMTGGAGERFVLVEHGRGAAGLAKTLRLESTGTRVTIVHTPPTADAVTRVVDEVRATRDFAEVVYGADGVRRVPTLRAMPIRAAREVSPLDATDVLLVTGGGKGITAECALAVAVDTGAKIAVLGRSDPEHDAELAANLERMARHGATVRYARADVTDRARLAGAVAELSAQLGPITAVLHGAGRNEPAGLPSLRTDELRRTFAPKVDGLRNVLDVLDPEQLRLLVSLGSIIGRSGLRGEAHYAVANDWMARLTREFGERHPRCRSLCLEWSVWSGVGMGERLSVIENLTREGITPITPAQGVDVLRRLLADADAPPVVVISGRTSGIDTIRYDRPELPLLRFVQQPLISYAGVELVTETELSVGTDPYLGDHLLDGSLLFPAVLGMEAMAQVAAAVTGQDRAPVIEDAQFLRPIVVPPDGTTRIRVAAVVTDTDTVEVVIRSEETGYAAEHFRARVCFTAEKIPQGPPEQTAEQLPLVPLDPQTELYGDILFQGGRFQRLRAYHRAAAREVDATVELTPAGWFAGYLPDRLLLGDPGVRDALMHGNQVCVPHATLLPSGIERVYAGGAALSGTGELRYCATERRQDGDTYVYDIAVRDADGQVVERWEGLTLQAVRKNDGSGRWAAPLLGTYLERVGGQLTGSGVRVSVEPDDVPDPRRPLSYVEARRSRSARALSRLTGQVTPVRHRTDGRPEIDGGTVSMAHGAGVTLCVLGTGAVGADIEVVTERSLTEWRGLLGTNAALLADLGDGPGLDVTGTRIWVALECLQKAGQPPTAPLTVLPAHEPGWLVFASGRLQIATFVAALRGGPDQTVFGILSEGRRAG